jgi:hypothetical protein
LRDAMHGRFARLMGRDEPLFQQRGPSISVRVIVSLAPYSSAVPHTCQCIGPDGVQISGPGYQEWSCQIPTRDFRNPVTRAKLAKNVAQPVARFITVSIIFESS